MFIPIDARADVENSKKGKLTPAQHAQLNAFCLTEKTGIFDCLGRCEYISPITINSINHTATITFRSGYVVICGRLVECEEGTTFTADLPVNGEETGYIVLRYDLSSFENNEFKVIQKTGELTQQDLNENPVNGIYEFVLYEYSATSSSMTLTRNTLYFFSVEKSLSDITISTKEDLINNRRNKFISFSNNVEISDVVIPQYSKGTLVTSGNDFVFNVIDTNGINYVGFFNATSNFHWTIKKIDISEIERRLNNLGFKEGAIVSEVSGSHTSINIGTIKRIGNYVLIELTQSIPSSNKIANIEYSGSISDFKPKNSDNITLLSELHAGHAISLEYNNNAIFIRESIMEDVLYPNHNLVRITKALFGYEAEPIN